MLTPPIEPSTHHRRLILEYVPPLFLRDYLRSLLWAHKQADEICREHFDDPEVHDGVGDVRRLFVEGSLRHVGRNHGAKTRAVRNRAGTAFYSRADFGPFCLTECSVDLPGRLRRKADFRIDLAEAAQGSFSFMRKSDGATESTKYYAILYHGHFIDNRKKKDFDRLSPEFAGIVFPNEDCSESVATIDLTLQLRHEITASRMADVEEVGELNLQFTAKTGTKIEEEG